MCQNQAPPKMTIPKHWRISGRRATPVLPSGCLLESGLGFARCDRVAAAWKTRCQLELLMLCAILGAAAQRRGRRDLFDSDACGFLAHKILSRTQLPRTGWFGCGRFEALGQFGGASPGPSNCKQDNRTYTERKSCSPGVRN